MIAAFPEVPDTSAVGVPDTLGKEAILAARGLHVRHPKADRDAVRGVHLDLRQGELLCLVGPNGSGKSTTLAALGRELRPRRGEVTLDGRDIWHLGRRRFAQRVARLPQEPLCPEGLTVEELVRGGRHPHRSWLRSLTGEDRDAVHEALDWMDLLDLRGRSVETLSGGERRRSWLAMVLCQDARVLLLDEPTTGLDLRHEWEVLDHLSRLHRERGTSVVLVLHDLEQALARADRVAVFVRGRLYATGAPATVLTAETLADVFGIEARISAGPERPTRLEVVRPVDPIRNL